MKFPTIFFKFLWDGCGTKKQIGQPARQDIRWLLATASLRSPVSCSPKLVFTERIFEGFASVPTLTRLSQLGVVFNYF